MHLGAGIVGCCLLEGVDGGRVGVGLGLQRLVAGAGGVAEQRPAGIDLLLVALAQGVGQVLPAGERAHQIRLHPAVRVLVIGDPARGSNRHGAVAIVAQKVGPRD